MSTDIELVQTALTEFDKVGAGLAILTKNFAGVLYDVETPMGMDHAKAARRAIREPRFEIERIRKEAKAPLLAIGKKLDSEAQRITAELVKLETPIDQQIKSEETRKEREAAEKLARETARIEAIQARIAAIRNMAMIPSSADSAAILARHAEVKALVLDGFQEFTADAQSACEQTAAILFGLHTSAVAREQETIRIAAEREELDKLRAAQALRDAEERKAREQEQARQAEELRIERERLATERAENERIAREAREQQEAANKAERERIAEEDRRRQAERARVEAEARKVREAEEARIAAERKKLADEQEAARVKAARERTAKQQAQRDAIVQLVAKQYELSNDAARELITELFA